MNSCKIVAVFPDEVINIVETGGVRETITRIVGEKLLCEEISIRGLDRKGVRYELYYSNDYMKNKIMANRVDNFVYGVPQRILYGPLIIAKKYRENFSSLDTEEIKLIALDFNSFQRDPWAKIRNEIKNNSQKKLEQDVISRYKSFGAEFYYNF